MFIKFFTNRKAIYKGIIFQHFQSYWPFLIVRGTMGFGECGFATLAPTLLVDLFHGKEATYILALFYFANIIGRYKFIALYFKCNSILNYSFFENSIFKILKCYIVLKSGLGYIVGSGVATLAGSWRWGLRITPIFACMALAVGIFSLRDPPRGNISNSREI